MNFLYFRVFQIFYCPSKQKNLWLYHDFLIILVQNIIKKQKKSKLLNHLASYSFSQKNEFMMSVGLNILGSLLYIRTNIALFHELSIY